MNGLRVVFWGSDDISVPFLRMLAEDPRVVVAGVVSRSDKPKGRGLQARPTPVSSFALERALPLLRPHRIDGEVREALRAWEPDLGVVVSYGALLPEEVLSAHRIGVINVHFSLLPKYRGAAPIQWALINGETKTGVTIFWLDRGLDTGPVFLQREVPVGLHDTYATLSRTLAGEGVSALRDAIGRIIAGSPVREPQRGEPSHAPLITKPFGWIDWRRTAFEIHNLVRALCHWPRAYSRLNLHGSHLEVKVLRTEPAVADERDVLDTGGVVEAHGGRLAVRCGKGTRLLIQELQPANKRPMTARDFLCGHPVRVGDRFEHV